MNSLLIFIRQIKQKKITLKFVPILIIGSNIYSYSMKWETLLNILVALKLVPSSGFGKVTINFSNGKIVTAEKFESIKPD